MRQWDRLCHAESGCPVCFSDGVQRFHERRDDDDDDDNDNDDDNELDKASFEPSAKRSRLE